MNTRKPGNSALSMKIAAWPVRNKNFLQNWVYDPQVPMIGTPAPYYATHDTNPMNNLPIENMTITNTNDTFAESKGPKAKASRKRMDRNEDSSPAPQYSYSGKKRAKIISAM